MFKSYEQTEHTEHTEQYLYECMNDLLSRAPIMGQKKCRNKQEILQVIFFIVFVPKSNLTKILIYQNFIKKS